MRRVQLGVPLLGLFAVSLFACGNNDPAPPTTSPSGIGAAGAAGAAGAGGAGGASVGYPSGPFGVNNGDVIGDIGWNGWRDPVAAGFDDRAFDEIFLHDYYDPDGIKGYRAIVVNAAARWCSICKIEQSHIRKKVEEWGPNRVVFIETLFEDSPGAPAKPSDLVAWGNRYRISWVLVLDPSNKLSPFFDPSASPMNMVIDARTMKIRDIVTGLPDESWWTNHLEALTSD